MRKRNVKEQTWLTRDEQNILKGKAKKAGMSRAEFIRNLIVNCELKEMPNDKFYDALKLMRSMSNNLNQIARKANSLGFVDALYYQREAEKWNKFIAEIKKEYLR